MTEQERGALSNKSWKIANFRYGFNNRKTVRRGRTDQGQSRSSSVYPWLRRYRPRWVGLGMSTVRTAWVCYPLRAMAWYLRVSRSSWAARAFQAARAGHYFLPAISYALPRSFVDDVRYCP